MPGFQDFVGEWRITRSIQDHTSGHIGQFTGSALLTAVGEGHLRYVEAGQLRLTMDGPAFEARRDYGWCCVDGRIEVTFDDGRPFHSFVPQGAVAGTDHPCGADFYRVRYDFTLWPRWSAQWDVTGPRKDYRMMSVFDRL